MKTPTRKITSGCSGLEKLYFPALAGADAGIDTLSITDEDAFLLEIIVNTMDVAISTAAKIAVNLFTALNAVGLANKLSAPDAPKIPAAEPFPLCNKTSKINKTQTIKCNVKISPYMKNNLLSSDTILYQFFCRKDVLFDCSPFMVYPPL